MIVKIFNHDGNKENRWDAYVLKNHYASHYHLSGWQRVIESAYGCRPIYMIAEEGGITKGILPLFEVKGLFSGRLLVSLPFLDYGGICADDEFTKKSLLQEALAYCKKKRIKILDLRHQDPSNLNLRGFKDKVTLILDLENGSEKMWKKLGAKVRNQVRKAMKAELSVQWSRAEVLEHFYNIYAANMRDLGSPAHSIKFFKAIFEEFHQAKIILARYKNQVIGGGLCLYFNNTVMIPWASSLRKYFHYCPNNLIYWEAIRAGCEEGFQKFDFGRSSYGSGTYHFKKQWGASERPLSWEYWSNKEGSQPIIQSNNSGYRFLVKVWKNIPLPITNFFGPYIRKRLSN